MNKLSIGLGTLALGSGMLFAVIVAGLTPSGVRPGVQQDRHSASMAESATAMREAGEAMWRHGEAMLDEGKRTGNAGLLRQGEQWILDGRQVAEGGAWMGMNPAVPANLLAPPSSLAARGDLAALGRANESMAHDTAWLQRARRVDIEALRWNGEYMRDEGGRMVTHAMEMWRQVETMGSEHSLDRQTATELQTATQTLMAAGEHARQSGQSMIDYADRLRRSIGRR
jgi:hypothetical protein